MHPRPPGRHLREILSFRLKFSCLRHVSILGFQKRIYLSVYTLCPSVPREKKFTLDFINISSTLVIDTSLEGVSLVLQYGRKKIEFFFSKKLGIEFWLLFWLVPKNWNHISIVNISHTLVIDTSLEGVSLVLQYGRKKIEFFFQKSWELNSDFYFDLCQRTEITLASLISVIH